MAKQLRDYKRKEIECLIVEDFETGVVFKVVGEENIKGLIEKYSENETTYVYTPTQEQRKEILGLFKTSQEGDKVVSKMSEYDILTKMIPMLTDIVVDIENEDDINIIRDIISDPDKVFSKVLMELNSILLDINIEYIENLKTLNKLPIDIVDVMTKQLELEVEQDATV